jgi:hypothetical protein
MVERKRSKWITTATRGAYVIEIAVVLGLFGAGCSSSAPPPAKMAAIEKVELHFSLDQCQPLDANIYKCPAVDKPICSHDYNGSLDCVRIGPKGSVFVEPGLLE